MFNKEKKLINVMYEKKEMNLNLQNMDGFFNFDEVKKKKQEEELINLIQNKINK